MEIFRISTVDYSSNLSASGSANRWNKKEQYVIYTGSSRALSSLELVVHRSSIKPHKKYKVMIIYLPDEDDLFQQVLIKDLPKKWRSVAAYPELQSIGSNWYSNKESLVLKIPSVVIPQEYNFIINTVHPDFSKVQLLGVEDYFWDSRLL